MGGWVSGVWTSSIVYVNSHFQHVYNELNLIWPKSELSEFGKNTLQLSTDFYYTSFTTVHSARWQQKSKRNLKLTEELRLLQSTVRHSMTWLCIILPSCNTKLLHYQDHPYQCCMKMSPRFDVTYLLNRAFNFKDTLKCRKECVQRAVAIPELDGCICCPKIFSCPPYPTKIKCVIILHRI